MKKIVVLFVPLFISYSLYSIDKTGQSFMFTRPIYRNIAAQVNYAQWQLLPMWQRSIQSEKTQRFFLINQKTSLLVKGDNAADAPNRDVRAEWIGLPDDFSGVMSLDPEQQQIAVWNEYNVDICDLCDCALFQDVWFRISAPVQAVKNNVNITQKNISNPGNAPVANIIQAFSQPRWLYGKFRDSSKQKVALGEMMFKLGTTLLRENGFNVAAYSGLVAPGYGAQNAEYIFNPFIGNNNHWGFASGAFFQLPLTCTPADIYWAWFFDIENITFLGNTQYRTIELKKKPWSRYLLYNTLDGEINVPGVNILTRKVSVKPYNFVDLSTGFRYFGKTTEIEVAYNLWAHGNEILKLKEPFKENFGIAGVGTVMIKGIEVGATASESTIECLADDDMEGGNPTFVPVRERDLDFKKAASPSAVTHRASLNVYSYFGNECEYYVGVGGHIEITQKNTALSTWALWANVGRRL